MQNIKQTSSSDLHSMSNIGKTLTFLLLMVFSDLVCRILHYWLFCETMYSAPNNSLD